MSIDALIRIYTCQPALLAMSLYCLLCNRTLTDETVSGDDPEKRKEEGQKPEGAQPKRMTKMEHYKKRLIHQHEKPAVVSPQQVTAEEEDESPAVSPVGCGSSQPNALQEKRREDGVTTKVARKRAVCRSKFRHRDMELFKLGTSYGIPTSLCKSKEPYNVCAEKNLQMCCQSLQQNGKKDDVPVSITDAIINSMEGSKRKDALLWRSMSLNNDRPEVPEVSNNNVVRENAKSIGNGKHVLPAIVPEVVERKRRSLSVATSSEETMNGWERNAQDIPKSAPVSINAKKVVPPTRISVESSPVEHQTDNERSPMEEWARKSMLTPNTEPEISQHGPINLSLRRSVEIAPPVVQRNAYNDPPNEQQEPARKPPALPQTPAQEAPRIHPAQEIPRIHPADVAGAYYFPEIQQQLTRMSGPNAPAGAVANEELIRTIINLVKSSMDPTFSIEVLLILNKWYIELRSYSVRPGVSQGLRVSIARALGDVLLYVSDKVFQAPLTERLQGYAEEMMQAPLSPHKDLLASLLPLLARNHVSDEWMRCLLTLLAHPPASVAPRGPYFAAECPPPPPYDGQHIRVNAVQRQPTDATQFRGLYQNTPPAYTRPDRLYLADNRCIPPKNGPQPNPPTSNGGRYLVSDALEIIPIRKAVTPNMAVPQTNLLQRPNAVMMSETHNRNSSGNEQRNTDQINSENASMVNISSIFPTNLRTQLSRLVNNQNSQLSIASATVSEQTAPDVEQLLRTNVIYSKAHALTSDTTQKVNEDNAAVEETSVSPRNQLPNETIDPDAHLDQEVSNYSNGNTRKTISSTVIVQDNSMEITRGRADETPSRTVFKSCDDMVVERVQSTGSGDTETTKGELKEEYDVKNETEYGIGMKLECELKDEKDLLKKEEENQGQEFVSMDDDEEVLIEEVSQMPKPKEPLPILIKLPPLKRKDDKNGRHLEKRRKSASPSGCVVVIDDEGSPAAERTKHNAESDYNQNYITRDVTDEEKPVPNHPPAEIIEISDSPVRPMQAPRRPVIEDISSDEESLGPVRHRDTYESKVSDDPRQILQTSEVSHCTLIEDSVRQMERRSLPKRPLVYTRPLGYAGRYPDPEAVPEPSPKESGRLSSNARFEGDHASMTCSVRVRNASDLRYAGVKGAPPAFKSPIPAVCVTSPTSVPTSPVLAVLPMTAGTNWKGLFTDEQKRSFLEFRRSISTESAGSPEHPREGRRVRHQKRYRLKRKQYEKVPRGKLCYIRENNTFVRYFDGDQMEQFVQNLGEGSAVASDLLRQIKGRADSSDAAGDHGKGGEIITLSKDVRFSEEDFISDPQLYVEEVERVERHAPRDFCGFYKYVTGYQIVHNHPPISFQTFLTMHNTNRVRTLLRNYVNALVEGEVRHSPQTEARA
ncbi:hypothetical protein NQ318_002791 [Aromia moschata]|uniref:Uncharacterized protein n=1 Tax=Aromia moschata TaxID=1265417 RepID=A0AAV8XUV2_9CUCU|nr:hypothetical protein NQ318_002791 [Aromia moschata]